MKHSLEVHLSELSASRVPSAPDRDHLAKFPFLNRLSEQVAAGLIMCTYSHHCMPSAQGVRAMYSSGDFPGMSPHKSRKKP